MKRRDAIKAMGAVTALPVLGQISSRDLAALGARIRTGGVKPVTGPLATLDAHQNATVTTIAELIIPETDTPGAAAVGVNEFMDVIVGEWYDAPDREAFLVGLARIDGMTGDRWDRPFVDCEPADQVDVLTELEAESFALKERQEAAAAAARGEGPFDFPTGDVPDSRVDAAPAAVEAEPEEIPWNEHIFQRLKYLTLYGYYTSEEGAVGELHFKIIPGEFQGCLPYEEVHGHPEPQRG